MEKVNCCESKQSCVYTCLQKISKKNIFYNCATKICASSPSSQNPSRNYSPSGKKGENRRKDEQQIIIIIINCGIVEHSL